MNHTPIAGSSRSEVENVSVPEDVSNMSPMTTLTLNLNSLSTSVSGTPNRRISWSNPFPSGSKTTLNIGDFSPAADSPTFIEVLSRKGEVKPKVRPSARKLLPSDNEDEKENIFPSSKAYSGATPQKSESSLSSECDSQDSGYSGLPEHLSLKSLLGPDSRAKVRSSVFADDEDDGFENIFQMDEGDDEQELTFPDNMSCLLTKPLCSNTCQHNAPTEKRVKLPIRRCLSMEIGSETDLCVSTPKTCSTRTFVASSSFQNDSMDCEFSTRCPFKRPEPPNNFSSQNKRRKSSPSVKFTLSLEKESCFVFQRSFSETAATITHAIQKSDLQPELVGDCSRSYALPLVKGRHHDLKSISPETLVRVLNGEYDSEVEKYTLVDCRYPYEFEGGHILGAKNIFTKEDILDTFLKDPTPTTGKNVIIFHCEFSSERAPNLCRFLRSKDREMNQGNYPRLHHPEVYILEGGYKAFFKDFREYCEPQEYKPMNHKDHGFELRHFRAKSKSWGADCKGRSKLRSSSNKTN